MNFKEIKKLLKENDIHFYSYWDRKKLINLAVENNLLPDVKEDQSLKKVRMLIMID